MIFTIFLIGYGNNTPAAFFERLESWGDSFLVLDVRLTRRSWAWSYSGPQIEFVCKKRGHDYIWLPDLGNMNRNGEVHLVNEQVGMWALERLLRKDYRLPIVLLCAERLGSRCHRTVVAEKLRDRLTAKGDLLEIRPL